MTKPKLIRITTVPMSFRALLCGQPGYMAKHFEVTCVSSGPDNELAEIREREGVEVARVDMTRQITPFKDLVSLYRLYRYLKKQKPQIVHTHTPKAGLLGMIAARLAGVPIRMHTVAGLPLVEASGAKRKLLNFVEKITYRFATKVYPNSQGLQDFIIENKFCKTNKLKVIANGSSNGINTKFFSPENVSEIQKETLKRDLKIDASSFVFVFVGRLVSHKGINELVEAFLKIRQKHQNAKLLLVGWYEPKLDALAPEVTREINSNQSIISAGTQADVRPSLAISNCLVLSSYREGFPNAPMQAGAMGLPSIVTNINGCNEIVVNSKTGLIIPVKDTDSLTSAMAFMIANRAEAITMGREARIRITGLYDQQKLWDALLDEYNLLLKNVR